MGSTRRELIAGGAAWFAAQCVPRSALAVSTAERVAVQGVVAGEARAMRFSPSLAMAVAHAESYFDPLALSRKGARGVMQIMPATAAGEYGIDPELLWDCRLNVRLGVHFLGRLIRRYQGRTDLALSYYNGGSAVGELPYARVLPFTATYVRKVHDLERAYRPHA